MGKLNAYATASSMGKEDRMYKIFAYLQTKQTFNPVSLTTISGVSAKTTYNYLKEIQQAQMLTPEYKARLQSGYENKPYVLNSKTDKERNYAIELYNSWLNTLNNIENIDDSKQQAFLQFTFQSPNNVDYYNRLEQSLLVLSLLANPKKGLR